MAQKITAGTNLKINHTALKMGLAIIARPQTNTFQHVALNQAAISPQSKSTDSLGKHRCERL
jgi:hypothetical protein